MIPEGAPFSPEQRSWLNGFFAGLLSLDAAAGATALDGAMPDAAAKALGGEDDGAPWHDAAMPIAERMTLAEGKPLPRKLFAAMAQQDCGQCGYLCETYSQAIAEGKEAKLNLCAPGGKETSRMLKRLLEETPAATVSTGHSGARCRASGSKGGRSQARAMPPWKRCSCPPRRLNGDGSEKDTRHVVFDHRRQRPQLRAGRQLRPVSRRTIRRWPTPCLPPCACRPISRRRQADPRCADRGLRARPRARHAVRADELSGRRRAAAEGQAAGQRRRSRWRRGHARRAGGAGEVRAGASRSGSVRGMPGAAAAAALFHRLVPALRRLASFI